MDKVINLTHLTVLQWILIVIFSGIVVAIINQLGAWIVSSRQSNSQERMQEGELAFRERQQKDERENQSLQLLITAHFNQREESLRNAVDVRQWVWEQTYRIYGPDHDYYGDNEPAADLASVADVLSALNRILYYHPTKSIRDRAKDLRSAIRFHYNRVSDDFSKVGGTPSEDDLDKWLDSADELIELIHTPPSLDEVQYPGSDRPAH